MPSVRKIRGRWGIDFRDASGKRRREVVEPNTFKNAHDELRERLDKVARGRVYDDPKFGKFASNWLKRKRVLLRPGTVSSYKAQVVRLCVYLGEKRLSELHYPAIESFRDDLMEAETLSPRTVNACLTILGTILQDARRAGLILDNPVRLLRGLPVQKKEMDFLTHREIPQFLDGAGCVSDLYRTLAFAAIFTGLRRGELLALRWQDIDFQEGKLRVRRSWKDGTFQEPKSVAGKRTVHLPPQLVTELKTHRLRSGNPPGGALVFQQESRPLPLAAVSRNWLNRSLRACGLRESLRFHDLRHTFAALLIHQGESPKYVQNQMGHSSIVVTLDNYGHIFPDEGKAAAAKLGELFSSGHKSGT